MLIDELIAIPRPSSLQHLPDRIQAYIKRSKVSGGSNAINYSLPDAQLAPIALYPPGSRNHNDEALFLDNISRQLELISEMLI